MSKLRLPRRNLSLMIAVGELELANASYTIKRSRHYRIRWEVNGSRGVFTIPVSASTLTRTSGLKKSTICRRFAAAVTRELTDDGDNQTNERTTRMSKDITCDASTEEKDRHERNLALSMGGREAADKLNIAADGMEQSSLAFGLMYFSGCVLANMPASIEDRREILETMIHMLRGFFEDALMESRGKTH